MNKKKFRDAIVYLAIGLALLAYASYSARHPFETPDAAGGSAADNLAQPAELTYTALMRAAKDGWIKEATVSGNVVTGTVASGSGSPRRFRTEVPEDARPSDALMSEGVDVSAGHVASLSLWERILISWGPSLLFMGIVFHFVRRMGKSGPLAIGRSRAKRFVPVPGNVKFSDVAGVDAAKDGVFEIVEFLKNPGAVAKLGGKMPTGVLLVGPPGTGKTLLAKAIASEAGVPFFATSGSEFVEMFVGLGASRVADMFDEARKAAPCIVFIDEIDAIGKARGNSAMTGGNDERENTLNQILVEMDGFQKNDASNRAVVVIAATNRPEVLDPALSRTGRFDRRLDLVNPDLVAREKILAVHFAKIVKDPHLDLRRVAQGTPGFSGSDLANLANEAALLAARRKKDFVSFREVDDAKDKIIMGAENRTLSMTDEEKKLTAYHEAAHALVAIREPASDPVYKATIVPRGRALGMVMRYPEGDRVSLPRRRLDADLAVLAAGREGEKLIFGEDGVTTGASGDIQMATRMARAMVVEWGMTTAVGAVLHADDESAFSPRRLVSEKTKRSIDAEVKRLLDDAANRARNRLIRERGALDRLAAALLERETLDGGQVRAIAGDPPEDFPAVPPLPLPDMTGEDKARADASGQG